MSERDELAGIAQQASTVYGRGIGDATARTIAYAILTAGYRKPREVTTAAELDALPVGSVVLNKVGYAWRKGGRNWYVTGATGGSREVPFLPATVLHEPEGGR